MGNAKGVPSWRSFSQVGEEDIEKLSQAFGLGMLGRRHLALDLLGRGHQAGRKRRDAGTPFSVLESRLFGF